MRWLLSCVSFAGPLTLLMLLALVPLGACESSGDQPDAAFLGVQGEASAPLGTCAAIEQLQQNEGWTHEPVCSYIKYFTSPPSSGNHYPIWAAYKSYATAVPEGFWVHNLEHGAVVFSYNCARYPGADASAQAAACAADVAAAQAVLDALPVDPQCTALGSPVPHRTLMTPDPNLDVPFAASAWTWTLRAQCFDPVVFGQFITDHMDQGREDICADGDDVTIGLQAGCDEP